MIRNTRAALSGMFFLSMIILGCSSKKAEEAAKYNDQIIEHQMRIVRAFDELDTSFTHYNAEDMEYAHVMLIAEVRAQV